MSDHTKETYGISKLYLYGEYTVEDLRAAIRLAEENNKKAEESLKHIDEETE